MPKYNLRWADGDDAGEVSYPTQIDVGDEIRIEGNGLVRVRARVAPASSSTSARIR